MKKKLMTLFLTFVLAGELFLGGGAASVVQASDVTAEEMTEELTSESTELPAEDAIEEELPAEDMEETEDAEILVEEIEAEKEESEEEPEVTTYGTGSNMTVTFLDVGQGNATLIEDNGVYTLVDTGLESKYSVVKNYLTKRGITKLTNLVITHPDADHMGGADLVIQDYPIDHFYTTDYSSTTNEYKEMMNAASAKGLSVEYVTAGKTLEVGGSATCTVLSPEDKNYDASNDASVVLKVVNGKNSFLLTGDIPAAVEGSLWQNYDVDVDVLQVAHHGSDYSSAMMFLSKTSPAYAVISVGADNSYGHPSQTVLNRLANFTKNILRTDKNGTIVFQSDGTNLTVSMEKKEAIAPTTPPTKPVVVPKLNASSLRLTKGDSYKLKVTGISGKVKWKSSNKKIATVSATGKVLAKKNGKCTIKATVSGKSFRCKITVKNPSISKKSLKLTAGQTAQLKVSGTTRKVKWSSSKKSVATVNSKGVVTAKKKGSAVITAKVGSIKLKCKVTVKKSSGSKMPSTSVGSGKIIGNKNTKKYHYSSCGHLPDAANSVYFNSAADAQAAGYSGCGYCTK